MPRITPVKAALLLAAVASLATLPRLDAMTVVPPTFARLVARAEVIARVEVTGQRTQWDRSPQGPVIHTYISCRVVRCLKGSTADPIELRFLGGAVGDTVMAIPGMPSLETGGTYILFVSKNGSAFCPLVAVGHGLYRVRTDPATGLEHIERSDKAPLRSVDEVSHPLRELGTASPGAAAGAMACSDFEAAIRNEISHPSTR